MPRAPDLHPVQEVILLSEHALKILAHTATCTGSLMGEVAACLGISL